MKFLRLLGAGLFVCAALFTGIVVYTLFLEDSHEAMGGPVMLAIGVAAVLAAFWIFNRRLPPGTDPGDRVIRSLEADDLLESQSFTARRAFEVEELEDEGPHYFIELTDGSILYLNGQYLYDYQLIDDDPDLNQPRRFPCTSFVIRRHRRKGYIVDIVCEGEVLEPELVAPPFTGEDYRAGRIPEDGQILDTPYDELKAARSVARPV